MVYDDATLKRFWSKVEQRGPDECWLWTACKDRCGYGRFLLNGVNKHANRIACILSHGLPDNKSLHAMHACDNPSCCNPEHLSWGTMKENMLDCRKRGRSHVCKLTALQVSYIKALFDKSFTDNQIGDWYGVSRITIRDIRYNKSWVDVPKYMSHSYV